MPARFVLAAGLVTALSIALFQAGALVLTRKLDHDENMYLAASQLLTEGSLYKDFAFLQTPYMPYAYRWAGSATEDASWLTLGRLVKLLIVLMLIVVFFGLTAHLSRDRRFALACSWLVVQNDIVRSTWGHARNYDLPMLLVLLALWLLMALRSRLPAAFGYGLPGLCVGLAIGTKLTYALVPVAFLVFILAESDRLTLRFAQAMWFSLAVVVALLPAGMICVEAGLDRAWFNNVSYHQLNAQWRIQTNFSQGISLFGKLQNAKAELLTLQTGLLLLLVFFLLHAVWAQRVGWSTLTKTALLPAGLVLVSVAMFLIPTPVWISYYSPFVIWLTVLIAGLYPCLQRQSQHAARTVAIVSVVLLLAWHCPSDLRMMYSAWHPQRWTCWQISHQAARLKEAIPQEHQDLPLATLSPLYALEAGLPIYSELATGPFAFRVADSISVTEQERLRITSADRLMELLAERPPGAVLVGLERKYDSALEDYAQQHRYQQVPVPIDRARLYVRPTQEISPR